MKLGDENQFEMPTSNYETNVREKGNFLPLPGILLTVLFALLTNVQAWSDAPVSIYAFMLDKHGGGGNSGPGSPGDDDDDDDGDNDNSCGWNYNTEEGNEIFTDDNPIRFPRVLTLEDGTLAVVAAIKSAQGYLPTVQLIDRETGEILEGPGGAPSSPNGTILSNNPIVIDPDAENGGLLFITKDSPFSSSGYLEWIYLAYLSTSVSEVGKKIIMIRLNKDIIEETDPIVGVADGTKISMMHLFNIDGFLYQPAIAYINKVSARTHLHVKSHNLDTFEENFSFQSEPLGADIEDITAIRGFNSSVVGRMDNIGIMTATNDGKLSMYEFEPDGRLYTGGNKLPVTITDNLLKNKFQVIFSLNKTTVSTVLFAEEAVNGERKLMAQAFNNQYYPANDEGAVELPGSDSVQLFDIEIVDHRAEGFDSRKRLICVYSNGERTSAASLKIVAASPGHPDSNGVFIESSVTISDKPSESIEILPQNQTEAIMAFVQEQTITAARIDSEGNIIWTNVLSNAPDAKKMEGVSGTAVLPAGNFVFAWGEKRKESTDIFGNLINSDGRIGSAPPAPAITSATYNAETASATITWTELGCGTKAVEIERKVDPTGSWETIGTSATTSFEDNNPPELKEVLYRGISIREDGEKSGASNQSDKTSIPLHSPVITGTDHYLLGPNGERPVVEIYVKNRSSEEKTYMIWEGKLDEGAWNVFHNGPYDERELMRVELFELLQSGALDTAEFMEFRVKVARGPQQNIQSAYSNIAVVFLNLNESGRSSGDDNGTGGNEGPGNPFNSLTGGSGSRGGIAGSQCFIATASMSGSRNKRITELTGFRDSALLRNSVGASASEMYKKSSQKPALLPVASDKTIKKHMGSILEFPVEPVSAIILLSLLILFLNRAPRSNTE